MERGAQRATMHPGLVRVPRPRGEADAGVGVCRAALAPGPQVCGLLEAHLDLGARGCSAGGRPWAAPRPAPARHPSPLHTPRGPSGPAKAAPHLLASKVIPQGEQQASPVLGAPGGRLRALHVRLHLGRVGTGGGGCWDRAPVAALGLPGPSPRSAVQAPTSRPGHRRAHILSSVAQALTDVPPPHPFLQHCLPQGPSVAPHGPTPGAGARGLPPPTLPSSRLCSSLPPAGRVLPAWASSCPLGLSSPQLVLLTRWMLVVP